METKLPTDFSKDYSLERINDIVYSAHVPKLAERLLETVKTGSKIRKVNWFIGI